MKNILLLAFITMLCLPIIFWVSQFYDGYLSNNTNDWSNFGNFIGGVLSPILAFISFLGLIVTIHKQEAANQRLKDHEESKVYCDKAVQTLERSFLTFTGEDESADKPIQDRLIWLTTAKLILSAKNLYSKIPTSEKSLREFYLTEEEYWRIKYYQLLDLHNVNSFSANESYFSKPSETFGDEIEERSIKVIYDFVERQEDIKDPIKDAAYFTEEEIENLWVGKRGLKEFLSKKSHKSKHRD